ncbi:ankyrin repeat protein [Seminavis robusta]|uniref:Ankyrin repeat protein n=1 Tax=Seminavis robusta TaxID=568900 RepID=A0A9N8HZI9_9STRA|nr:ankyrin repeat protein [Seminavis robusta]|eukprot:Sro3648_g349980.1 ankyrin repeat protein (255) ;mRNA; f:3009-3773
MGERNGGTAAARLQLVLEEEELPPCLERIREILGDDRSATKKVLPCGRSPLHVACDNPFIEKQVFDFLISEWPESVRLEHFDEDDPDIDLPIHVACYSGCSTAIIRALAEQYPESLKKPTTESSFTPLHLAALCTKRSLETIQFLAQQCPESVRARDRDGDLPLHDALRALRFGSEEPAPTTTELVKLEEPASTTADIVELLVDSFPESLMMRGDMERLPIHVACDRGAPLEVLKLVALGSRLRSLERPNTRIK